MVKHLCIAASLVCLVLTTNAQKKLKNIEHDRGLLISKGGSDFFFIKSPNSKNVSKILADTNNVAIELTVFLKNVNKDSTFVKMKKFDEDYYQCGEWAEFNQLKYSYVEIVLINKEKTLNAFWKKEVNKRGRMCYFSKEKDMHSYFKYRVGNKWVQSLKSL